MNQRQAKAYALRALAAEARHHIGNGSEWLERPLKADGIQVDAGGEFSVDDHKRVCRAVEEIADELERRAERLSQQRSQQ